MTYFWRTALAALAFLISFSEAKADDRCSEILKDGTRGYAEVKSTDYFRQSVLSSYVNQSSDDRSTSANGSVDEVETLKGMFGYSQSRDLHAYVNSMNLDERVHRHAMDVALNAGDSKIIGAWSDCMRLNQAGPTIRVSYEKSVPTEATIYAKFFPIAAGNLSSAIVSDDTTLEDGITPVSMDQYRNCLGKGATIAMTECAVKVRLANAMTSHTILLATGHGNAETFLPPRLKFYEQTKGFDVQSVQTRILHVANNEVDTKEYIVSLDSALRQKGWFFLPDAISESHQMTWGGDKGGECDRVAINPDMYTITFRYRLAHGRNVSVDCKVSITNAELKRVVVVAEGSPAPSLDD